MTESVSIEKTSPEFGRRTAVPAPELPAFVAEATSAE